MDEKIEITSLAFGGKGVGRIRGKVVFVPFSAPGDVVHVELVTEKKGYSEGVIRRIETPSLARVEPVCLLYGECGGCNLQHIGYVKQLEWKQRILEETLRRIGKIEVAGFDGPAAGSEAEGSAAGVRFERPLASRSELNYRARARFQVEGGRAGFFGAGSHRVVDVEACPLLDPLVNETFTDIRAALAGKRTPAHSFEVNLSERDSKTVAVFHSEDGRGFDWGKALEGVRHLKGFEVWASPDRRGKGKRVAAERDTMVSYSAGGVEFSAGASLFSQANRLQNRALIEKALDFAGLSGTEMVVDLFAGTGNLTLPFARRAREAAGVESAREAVRQARENAARNSIANARFFAADAAAWLKQNLKSLEKEEGCVLVLDPPRGGEPDIASALSGIRPGTIIYVSCSPPTLARDLSALAGRGYRVSRAVLIDMFPQTYHIESVIGLRLAE